MQTTMTVMKTCKIMGVVLFLSVIYSPLEASSDAITAGILKHHQQWNGFVDKLYQVHRKRLREDDYYVLERTGGYGGLTNDLEYYREVRYFNRQSRQLLSTVKWANRYPFGIHMIDLSAYDNKGRVKRHYSATYLPSRHTSPFETLITLHSYEGGYHSSREFDASDILIYEQCVDASNGKLVFAFHYEDIPESYLELGVDQQNQYRACFSHLETTAEPYTDPLKDPLL